MRLATSGIAASDPRVRGRASHAGRAPERGVNALYEMAHQVLQMRDLSNPSVGLQVNWTMARAGVVRNMIPPSAQAQADIRVERFADYDGIEQKLRERIKNKLLPESEVELIFERRYPAAAGDRRLARQLAAHAQQVYDEIGNEARGDRPANRRRTPTRRSRRSRPKRPSSRASACAASAPHSINAEYILIDSIEPRLYLAVRMIMDVAQGKAPLK